MQVIVLGMSALLAGPSLWTLFDHAEPPDRFDVTVQHVDGPFQAVLIDGGVATGAFLQQARPGMHVAWVLQLSAPATSILDLDTRLMRERDETVESWSHRELGRPGPGSHVYLLDQVLPTELKPGRYHIVQDLSVHGATSAHRLLPSIAIDVSGGVGL